MTPIFISYFKVLALRGTPLYIFYFFPGMVYFRYATQASR